MSIIKRNVTLETLRNSSIVCCIWIISVVALFYMILGVYWVKAYTMFQVVAYTILGLLLYLPAHELTHCLFFRIFSKKKITMGYERGKKILFAKVYVKLHDSLKRWQDTIVKLSPAVILTVIPTIVMLCTGYRSMLAYMFVMTNFIGSYFDFVDTIFLWRKKA